MMRGSIKRDAACATSGTAVMRVKAVFMNADISLVDLGELSHVEALKAFQQSPWEQELRQSEVLDAQNINCITPDFTISIEGAHLIAKLTERLGIYDLEVCIPRESGLLSRLP